MLSNLKCVLSTCRENPVSMIQVSILMFDSICKRCFSLLLSNILVLEHSNLFPHTSEEALE